MKQYTMKQIADVLGLSKTTVSLVLQGKGDAYRISRDTQQRILDAVAQFGYRPNYFATALNRKESGVIGAVFPDVFEPFMGSMIRGIESVLYHHGYSLMISTSMFDQDREAAMIDTMVYRGIDGLLLVPSMPFAHEPPYNSRSLDKLLHDGIPVVFLDRYVEGLHVPRVLQRDFQRSCEAVSACISQGMKRIVCVSFHLQATSIRDRLKGYADTMEHYRLEPRFVLLETLDAESSDLQDAVTGLLKEPSPPDAFFVTTSGIAEKLNWILTHAGISVPIYRFGSSSPWLSSPCIDIPQPHREMGMQGAALLIDLIQGKEDQNTTVREVLC